jgi:hypothetical protein
VEVLIQELDRRFSHSNIMAAMEVVFPQYWLNPKCDDLFPVHMQVIHKWYCEVREVVVPTEEHAIAAKELVPSQLKGRKQGPSSARGARGSGNLPAEQRGKKGEAGTVGHGSGSNSDVASEHRQVAQPLDPYRLDWQQSLFKLTMKQNAAKVMEAPHDVNPVTKLWQRLGCNDLLVSRLSEYMRLAEIAIMAVLGSTEDERTFSNFAFVKNKVRNRLGGHLDTTVKMYSQGFYDLQSFPYNDAFNHWRGEKDRVNAHL